MSVDYYLVSPSRQMRVQVGSIGFSGVQSYPARPECIAFVQWAIENHVMDIVFVDENRLFAMEEAVGEGFQEPAPLHDMNTTPEHDVNK